MFGRGDNTEFLTSDKRIGMVQTEHHCTWPAARQPPVLPSCHSQKACMVNETVDFFLKDTDPQNGGGGTHQKVSKWLFLYYKANLI